MHMCKLFDSINNDSKQMICIEISNEGIINESKSIKYTSNLLKSFVENKMSYSLI